MNLHVCDFALSSLSGFTLLSEWALTISFIYKAKITVHLLFIVQVVLIEIVFELACFHFLETKIIQLRACILNSRKCALFNMHLDLFNTGQCGKNSFITAATVCVKKALYILPALGYKESPHH
uniref:Uncharacterized protein n=1 Tax=Micrurus spixii TaxID=129469 RepID=A0A2D4M542_9SAUR